MNPTTDAELDERINAHFAETPEEPLRIEGLPERLYRAARGENISALVHMADSARKYRYECDHPKKRTKAMDFGVIVHHLALTPHELDGVWVKKKYPEFRTAEAKKWRDEQTQIILDDEDLAEMTAAAESIKTHPKAGWIVQNADKELSVWRIHHGTKLLLKGRIDLPFMDLENMTACGDIKKVQSIRPGRFRKDIGERKINARMAYYMDFIGASSAYLIAVEEAAPNDVRVFKLTAASIERGRALYESWLAKLNKCRKEDRWLGADEDSVMDIEEPLWAQKDDDYTAATIGA